MLGQTTFAWVNKRLRQATGKLDQLLGGISVILFGDFGQLPLLMCHYMASPSHKPMDTIYLSLETCNPY